MSCIVCEQEITKWKRFCRFFWAPRFCSISFVWTCVCSRKCYEQALVKSLEELQKSCGLTQEIVDLSNLLFTSIGRFVTVDEIIGKIGQIQTTDWAKHIIEAGYRKES